MTQPTYLDDATYERRRRRKIGALITVGAVVIVAIDVTAAIQWATGTRSATDSITTLLFTVAVVVAATWQFTQPVVRTCPGWVLAEGASLAGVATVRDENDTCTDPEDGHRPTTDEGEQR